MSKISKILIFSLAAVLLASTVIAGCSIAVFASTNTEIANAGDIEYVPGGIISDGNYFPDMDSVAVDKNKVTVDINSIDKDGNTVTVQTVELKDKDGKLEVDEIIDLGGGGDIVKIPGTVTVNGVELKVTRVSDDAFEEIDPKVVIFPAEIERVDKDTLKDCKRLERVILLGDGSNLKLEKNAFPMSRANYAVYVNNQTSWNIALNENSNLNKFSYWTKNVLTDGETILREISVYRNVVNDKYRGLKDLYDSKILK